MRRQGNNVVGDTVPRVPPEAKLISTTDVNALPPGSYLYFLSLAGECVYVGSTRNLKNRLPIHRSYNGPFDSTYYLSVRIGDRLYLERRWKLQLRPRYNTDCHKSTVDASAEDLPPNGMSITSPSEAPPISCVYFLLHDDRAFYVGKTTNLRARLGSHKSQGRRFDGIHYLPCERASMLSLEKQMRSKYGAPIEGNTSLIVSRERKTIRLMPDGSRAPQVHVSVTPEQRDAWKAKAASEGLDMSAWIRAVLDRAAKYIVGKD